MNQEYRLHLLVNKIVTRNFAGNRVRAASKTEKFVAPISTPLKLKLTAIFF